MNPVEAALIRIAGELEAAGKRWALVGGLAVSARAEPRTTRDVDLAVAVTGDDEAEALVHGLQGGGYRVLTALEQVKLRRLSTVRLSPRPEGTAGVVVDLLFASSGIEAEVVEAAERLEIVADLWVPVARLGHLLALKVLARDDRRRPQDRDDIRALLAEAAPADLEQARGALRLIEDRGFHRERRLVEAFEEILRESHASVDSPTG
ncbi:MAG: nucleotidyl transferase AbiEii/AbiGii toxin family protein [Myxococcales bacterium]|nr:nucleotidyl transferase AbiEii/AbiGii toxin family protein [Myxococcales bacterium]